MYGETFYGRHTAQHQTSPFVILGVMGVLILILFFLYTILYANSVDSDQTPRSAASNLGLHCLPFFVLWNVRHKRVNVQFDN